MGLCSAFSGNGSACALAQTNININNNSGGNQQIGTTATVGCPATCKLHEVPTNGGQTGGDPPFGLEGALDSVVPDNSAGVVCTPAQPII